MVRSTTTRVGVGVGVLVAVCGCVAVVRRRGSTTHVLPNTAGWWPAGTHTARRMGMWTMWRGCKYAWGEWIPSPGLHQS